MGGGARRPRAPTRRARRPKGADFVFSCVGNDDDLRSVALGDDGALAGMTAGAIYIDNTTASATVARELAEAAAEARASASSTRRSPAARPAPRTAR